jgi:putative transposase
MKILRAYKTELDVNNVQNTLLLKHAGTARFAYNWGLSEKKKAFDAKEKTPNAIELHRRLNAMKSTEFPWMYEVSKCAAQESLRNLDRAFDNFFRKCKLKKQGKFKGRVIIFDNDCVLAYDDGEVVFDFVGKSPSDALFFVLEAIGANVDYA